MAERTDDGRFQINDIELSIPPEQIRVQRESVNNMWQTLRTRSSIKSKSGFSTLNISMNAKFTTTITGTDNEGVPVNGLNKLRDLVSQFRVTPFCYVENLFLRNTILGGAQSPNMALALKQLQITKTASPSQGTNVVDVTFHFTWFNYLPFLRDFSFKRDFFSETEEKDPRRSAPWKTLYKAEQQRVLYDYLHTMDGYMEFRFTQFTQMQVKKYNILKRDVDALENLKQQVINGVFTGHNNGGEVADLVYKSLRNSLNDPTKARALTEEIVGRTTSMSPGRNSAGEELLTAIQGAVTEGPMSLANKDVWAPVALSDGTVPRFANEPTALPSKPTGEDVVQLERERQLDLGAAGLIVTHISISFENILASIPLCGHTYPTFQHIGSVDAIVTISMMTTGESSVRALGGFYSVIEDQALKMKQIPQGQRNLIVSNDLINMCGLREFMPNSLVIETVPGQPGTYAATLELIDNPITTQTREQITNGQSFTSSQELRGELAKVLLQHLKLVPNLFPGKNNVAWYDVGGVNLRNLKANRFTDIVGNTETGYYIYTGPKGGRNAVFQNLCEDFGQKLGEVFIELASEFIPVANQFAEGPLAEFFSLTDEQVFGIGKLQEDILHGFQAQDKTLRFGASTDFKFNGGVSKDKLQKIRRTAQEIIDESDEFSLQGLNQAREERIENGGPDRILTAIEDGHIKWMGRIADFINDKLSDWLRFSVRFLDDILLAGYINLDQFAAVKENVKQAAVAASGHCYPDFPLEQVVNLLRSSTDPRVTNALKTLEEDAIDKKLTFKNLGVSSLIGPDFYFFNHQSDTTDSLIPRKVMEEAVSALQESQGQMKLDAEKQWFNNVYDQKILGQDRAQKVKNQIADVNRDKSFWSSSAPDQQKQIQGHVRAAREGASVFAPNDLIDDGVSGLGPSLLEYSTASGNKYGPILLEDITGDTDLFDSVSVRREGKSLTAQPDHHAQCRHFFGVDALAVKPAQSYQADNDGSNNDPNNIPKFTPPVTNWRARITSRASLDRVRPDVRQRIMKEAADKGTPLTRAQATAIVRNMPNGVRAHEGLDFGGPVGSPLFACADGTVVFAGQKRCGGNVLRVQHPSGFMTVYAHLTYDEYFQKFETAIKNNDTSKLQVKQGDRICSLGNTGECTTGPHLHFELRKNGGSGKGKAVDPYEAFQGRLAPLRRLTPAISPQNDSLLTKSVEQLERDLHTGQGYSMARAYPTFRLYFIESDMGERKRFAFDDMFSYSSIKDIHLVRSRKIASDLLVVQLTNISGVLSKRRFDNAIAFDKQGNEAKERPGSPQRTNTKSENPIASLHLQPGMQVQMRLGYSSNPDDLEIVFNGVISDAAFTETDDLVTLTCQSFAIELVKNIHGEAKSYGGFFSNGGRTARILEEMMAMPEVVHFGRWEGGDGALGAFRNAITTRWTLVPSPQDDNIFAPTGRGIFSLFDSTEEYHLYQATIWDVFQEMSLRHPGYVAAAVPYEDQYGPRMTMFFGVPDQMYFARDPDLEEKSAANTLQALGAKARKAEEVTTNTEGRNVFTDPTKTPSAIEAAGATAKRPPDADKAWLKTALTRLGMDQGIIKPFRNYHVLTSTNHIIYNNISNSGYNTFNTVTLQYGDDEATPNEKTADLEFGDLNTFTLRCDAALPDEEVKELFAQYPNCVGYEMAKRYTVALLWWALKEGYKGNVIIIGNPKIKPYDICYIFDEYNDMFGPIEVEQVVHKFSQQTGFITEITPDMVLHVNEAATLSTSDAMGLMVEHGLKTMGLQSLPSVLAAEGNLLVAGAAVAGIAGAPLAGAAAVAGGGALLSDYAFAPIANMLFNSGEHSVGTGGSTNPFGLVGTFIFKKLITRTQLAHPFRASPLVKNGSAMIGGLPNRKTDGSFVQGIRKWAKEADEGISLMVSDFFDKINPNNYVGRTTGSFADAFWGREQ